MCTVRQCSLYFSLGGWTIFQGKTTPREWCETCVRKRNCMKNEGKKPSLNIIFEEKRNPSFDGSYMGQIFGAALSERKVAVSIPKDPLTFPSSTRVRRQSLPFGQLMLIKIFYFTFHLFTWLQEQTWKAGLRLANCKVGYFWARTLKTMFWQKGVYLCLGMLKIILFVILCTKLPDVIPIILGSQQEVGWRPVLVTSGSIFRWRKKIDLNHNHHWGHSYTQSKT